MRNSLAATFGLLIALVLIQCGTPPYSNELAISLANLQDRIKGGWAGQMVGVAYGYPTEFVYNQRIVPEDKMPEWTPDRVANALDQDELNVKMTFATVLDEKGLDATNILEGAGAIVTVPYLPSGGSAQFYLDGELDEQVGVFPDGDYRQYGDSAWHACGLENTSHTVRGVVLGEPCRGAQGSGVLLENLVVFR